MTGTRTIPIAGLAARLDARLVASRFIATVRHEIPSVHDLTAGDESVVEACVAGAVRFATRRVQTGRDVHADHTEYALLRQLSTAALRGGLSLSDLLRAYQIGARVTLDVLTETARTGDSHMLAPAVAGILRACDLLVEATTETYARLTTDTEDVDEQRAGQLLADMLKGRLPDGAATELLNRIGFHADRACWPFALAPLRATGRTRQLARLLRLNGMLTACAGDIVRGLAGNASWLFHSRVLDEAVVVLGEPAENAAQVDLDDLSQAARLARAAGRCGVVPISDFYLELLVRRSPRLADDLRGRVLGPLASYPELVETLRVLMEHDMDRTVAAQKLYVHRNTMSHRLRRIQELTGRRLSNPRDLALLYLAGMPRDSRGAVGTVVVAPA